MTLTIIQFLIVYAAGMVTGWLFDDIFLRRRISRMIDREFKQMLNKTLDEELGRRDGSHN